MTLTDRNDTDKRVGQFYTDTTSSNRDVWQIVFRNWAPSVTGYNEDINNGCWLDASCTMGNQLRTAAGYNESEVTIRQVLNTLTPTNNDGQGGTNENIVDAVNCFMRDTLNPNATTGPNHTITYTKNNQNITYLSEIELLSYLQSNKSLISRIEFVDDDPDTYLGHTRVIAGYQWNDELRAYRYNVIDNGQSYWVSYNYILSGTQCAENQEYYFYGEAYLSSCYPDGTPVWRKSIIAI